MKKLFLLKIQDSLAALFALVCQVVVVLCILDVVLDWLLDLDWLLANFSAKQVDAWMNHAAVCSKKLGGVPHVAEGGPYLFKRYRYRYEAELDHDGRELTDRTFDLFEYVSKAF